jgi:hypothetical protein
MSDLLIGFNGVVACEDKPVQVDGWVYATTNTYSTNMMLWCGVRNLSWYTDVDIQTYRLENHKENSHRWYFKDPEVATLFALKFS